jgi:hypothetical protein
VWHDFIGGAGTAMSPPLPTMVLFAVAITASASRRWAGTLGALAVAIGSIAFTLGIAIEPITLRVLSAHPDALKTPLTVLALAAAPATALAAALHLRQRLKARHQRSGTRRSPATRAGVDGPAGASCPEQTGHHRAITRRPKGKG